MSTFSGQPTTVTELDVHLVPFARVAPLATPEAFRAAVFDQRPMTCRTTYLAEDGVTRVVLEYPAKVVNVRHDRPDWQVDTGPILLPDFGVESDLLVGKLGLAYIVFNTGTRAEVLERRPTPIGAAGSAAVRTTHYSAVRVLQVRNEVFAAA
jgi:hypothetical protein